MKKIIISISIFIGIVFILIGIIAVQSNNLNYTNIKTNEIDSIMEANPNYNYIDVRTTQEYNQGHIPGFINIENTTILEGKANISKEQTVVVICRSGSRSKEVAEYLTKEGYEVINIEDGINQYEGELE